MKELPAIDLTGFNPTWGTVEHSWGKAVLHSNGHVWEHQYHCEVLARFNHDYLGSHLFIQVWDYAQQDDPDQRWQYVLVLDRPTDILNEDGLVTGRDWDWCIRTEWEGDHGVPTFAEVGGWVDAWLQAPEVLRFILE